MNPMRIKNSPVPSTALHALLTKACNVCRGSGWVCETHTLRAMGHEGCRHAGKPCRCNPEALAGWDDHGA
jgi:hypothetical protein